MKIALFTLTAALALGSTYAHADETDTWVVKVGAHVVNPKNDNGSLAGGTLQTDVGSNARPTITAEYMLDPNWGVEVLAAIPFQHNVDLNGAKAGSVKHLPPTLSLQYHFNSEGSVSPFIGAGINYTYFYGEHTTGPLSGAKLNLNKTFGAALHGGVDFRINSHWLFSLDARWIKISPDASVNGTKVGTVHIDPFIYGFAFGYRF